LVIDTPGHISFGHADSPKFNARRNRRSSENVKHLLLTVCELDLVEYAPQGNAQLT
jgi:hypothetical protein